MQKKFAPLINPNLSAFVMDEAGEMVGLGVGAPSLSAALQKSRGKAAVDKTAPDVL